MKTQLAAACAKSSKAGPSLREALPEDYEQIASIEARYGLAAKSYEEWCHLHLTNPVRYESDPPAPVGWVIESGDGRIVGSVGNIVLPYELGGRRIRAGTGRALVVEPAYRSLSLLLLDRLMHRPGVELFLTNAITPASAPSFDALGCARVPAGMWDRSVFWITHYRGFMASFLARSHAVAARQLSYPLAAAAFLKERLARRRTHVTDIEVQWCQGFDDRFEDFWEHLRNTKPHVLLADRSRDVLEWHFRHAMRKKQLWIAAAIDGPRIAAYALFDQRDNASFGLKRVRLVDFQSRDTTGGLLLPLLSWAIRKCRDEGIHMLESVGAPPGKEEWIAGCAPHQRKLTAWTYVYQASTPYLAECLRDPSAWDPTLFDASASL